MEIKVSASRGAVVADRVTGTRTFEYGSNAGGVRSQSGVITTPETWARWCAQVGRGDHAWVPGGGSYYPREWVGLSFEEAHRLLSSVRPSQPACNKVGHCLEVEAVGVVKQHVCSCGKNPHEPTCPAHAWVGTARGSA